MIGETIREFEIQSELGSGGYGAVYRAHDTSVNRDVAIKVILPQYADKPDFKQRFNSEAQTVARLESPRIVPLYQYWQDERGAFLVMRYIRGGSLRRIMSKQGAISLAQTVRIASDIAEALSVAHENDVIHRDLKPENILIDERGNAYLTDFGIAKSSNTENITEAGAIVGTWAYLSPEQVQNIDVSPQSDIYAFGILLYEMLAGKHPFHGVPVTMMVMKHLQDNVPDISDERPDLPPELNDILQKATAKDVEERYGTTLDLIADLSEAAHEGGQKLAAIRTVQTKAPSSPEERNRQAMLLNVRKFWIEGVLENSLHNTIMIDLDLKTTGGAVENPWNTILRTPGGDEEILESDILSVFERVNGKLLILGDPGGGKTTTLLRLTQSLLERAERDTQYPLPIVFNLSSWAEKQLPVEQWIVDELNIRYQVPRKVAEKWVADEELLLLLDGLDEVASGQREACVKAINVYRAEHGFVDVVVCSRVRDYEALSQQLRLNGAIVIQALDTVQITEYLNRQGANMQSLIQMLEMDENLAELSHSPLMLSIMALVYRDVSSGSIPGMDSVQDQRKQLFTVFVQRMFERQKAQQDYTASQTKQYLTWLAQQMQAHGLSLFQIEQLQPSWLNDTERNRYFRNVWIASIVFFGIFYSIPYFFGAPGIGMPWLTMGILNAISGIVIAITIITKQRYYWISPIIVGISGGIAWGYSAINGYGMTIAYFLGAVMFLIHAAINIAFKMSLQQSNSSPEHIPVLEQISFSREKVNLLAIIPGIITGSLWILAGQGWAYDVRTMPVTTVTVSVVASAIVFSIVFLLQSGLTVATIATRTRPNQGMRSSSIVALQAGLITAIVAASANFFGITPLTSLYFAASLTLVTSGSLFGGLWFVYGGYSVLRHAILRLVLQGVGKVPSDLARFLDYASSLILMRKVGGGYIFIHRYLLEYFAELQETDES